MAQFYSYLWLRADGTPYYAGKGTGRRAFKTHYKTGGLKLYPPKSPSRIVVFPMHDEATASESEKELIEMFGRKDAGSGWAAIAPCLRNFTNGGDGTSGRVYSTATIRKISLATARTQKGRKHSPNHVEKIAAANRGKKRTPEQLAQMSDWRRAHPQPSELLSKWGSLSAGRVASPAAKRHMRAAQKGHAPTFINRKHTPESIAKQSAARSAYWARRRQNVEV